MTIKRIDPGSLSKVLGILYVIIGLIAGVCFALVGIAGGGASREAMGQGGALFGAIFGVGAIVLLPILYGVLGFVGGWICAALYNWIARKFGGIVLETQ